MTPDPARLVLIPSYNTGAALLRATVEEVLRYWSPVWVVIDGSTDGSAEALRDLAEGGAGEGVRLIILPENRGKGAAVLAALREAKALGFTHALTMDADGQHAAGRVPAFMAASGAAPDAMILGRPVFDGSAVRVRVHGRKLSNVWTDIETLWAGIGDSLCGFRLYPVGDLVAVMGETRWMRRFDFEPEAAVRLVWRGVRPISLPIPVRYLRPDEGGVSHFRYARDNVLLTWMHARLVLGFLVRLPRLLRRRLGGERHRQGDGAQP
ncbi:MAG: glycosyltransferase family 2 protein [Geminicoccaceae bacterium]|nr:glycosyltransferase family 2 protein [Geminicoccaceae bacterium]